MSEITSLENPLFQGRVIQSSEFPYPEIDGLEAWRVQDIWYLTPWCCPSDMDIARGDIRTKIETLYTLSSRVDVRGVMIKIPKPPKDANERKRKSISSFLYMETSKTFRYLGPHDWRGVRDGATLRPFSPAYTSVCSEDERLIPRALKIHPNEVS
ncbi:hypothetical protein VNO77_15528 [Canavalia gladiata]|uniref:Uncharacterized protein n=1 Tax=Canavalia gladiata TaxID=3824 RepID=A0AAN9M4F3_CANGL